MVWREGKGGGSLCGGGWGSVVGRGKWERVVGRVVVGEGGGEVDREGGLVGEGGTVSWGGRVSGGG